MHYCLLPARVAASYKNDKRVICTLNGYAFHCACMPKKEGGHYINLGSVVMKKLKLKEGDRVNPMVKKDITSYQFDMPGAFKEVLASDNAANKIFHQLPPGNQRSLIFLVMQVKAVDNQIERALTIAGRLKYGLIIPRMILKKQG